MMRIWKKFRNHSRQFPYCFSLKQIRSLKQMGTAEKQGIKSGNISRLRAYMVISLGFGIVMGVLFPIYASFFVTYETRLEKLLFQTGCVLAGVLVGGVSYFIGKIVIIGYLKKPVEQLCGITLSACDDEQEKDPLNRLFEGIQSTRGILLSIVKELKSSEEKINQLESSLMEMLDSIQEKESRSLSEIDAAMQTIDRNNQLLSSTDGKITSDSRKITDFRNRLREFHNNMNSLIEELTTYFTETHESESQILSMGESYNTMVDQMNGTAQAILSFKKEIEYSRTFLENLKNSISRIDDFAAQTQIYSINANIEAANSGSAGKGFHVIAEGIAALAEEIIQTAGTIDQELENLNERYNFMELKTEEQNKALQDISSQLKILHSDQNDLMKNMQSKNLENRKFITQMNQRSELLINLNQNLVSISDSIEELKSDITGLNSATGDVNSSMRTNQDFIKHKMADFHTFQETFASLSRQIKKQKEAIESLNLEEPEP